MAYTEPSTHVRCHIYATSLSPTLT